MWLCLHFAPLEHKSGNRMTWIWIFLRVCNLLGECFSESAVLGGFRPPKIKNPIVGRLIVSPIHTSVWQCIMAPTTWNSSRVHCHACSCSPKKISLITGQNWKWRSVSSPNRAGALWQKSASVDWEIPIPPSLLRNVTRRIAEYRKIHLCQFLDWRRPSF